MTCERQGFPRNPDWKGSGDIPVPEMPTDLGTAMSP